MTVRVIDIETTGTDPVTDAIIEIASVDLHQDGTIANQRSTLVRSSIPVPPESSAVHHLIDEDLAFAPQLEEVLDQFRGADAYVAHNADFERSFLERLLGDAPWACTYKSCSRTPTRRSGIALASMRRASPRLSTIIALIGTAKPASPSGMRSYQKWASSPSSPAV
jgi:DNA polymerase III epsilon subunit-like protein